MEQRNFASEYQTEGGKLVGYAAVFDSPTRITEGGRTFTETIKRGAFRSALSGGTDIIATFNHDANQLLGRTSAGTLRLSEDDRGLRFEVDLPETQAGADVKALTARGDLRGGFLHVQRPTRGRQVGRQQPRRNGRVPLRTRAGCIASVSVY